MTTAGAGGALAFKTGCCSLYEGAAVRFLLGDAWRPGGLARTEELLDAAAIAPGARVLDVACGPADSATAVSARGGSYYGVDLSRANLARAAASAVERRLLAADAEQLPFSDGAFDAVLVQCSFCTFTDAAAAAVEIARVLRGGGCLLLADVTREEGCLDRGDELLLAKAACVADARPLAAYAAAVEAAGLKVERLTDCADDACQFLRAIDRKLLMARVAEAVGKLDLGNLDLAAARGLLRRGLALVDEGKLGYGYLIAHKP